MRIEMDRRPPSESTANGELLQRRRTAPGQDQIVLLLPSGEGPSGQLLAVLAQRGLRPVVVRGGESDGPLPDPEGVRVAVLLGSDRFADVAGTESLQRELDWLRRADAAGTAVLGVGHGARAMAVAFGGRVEAADRPNRGWTMVSTSVPHRIAGGPWLSWQHEVISLPPRAELLAHNRFGPQAFRMGRHLAIQFHPDATPEVLTRWAVKSQDALAATDVLATISRDAAAADVCAHRLFSAFVDEGSAD
jgi:GMP synthase-like glutamine amidotransferase